MVTNMEIKKIISKDKNIEKDFMEFKKLSKEINKLLNKDLNKLTPKKIIDLDKKTNKLNSKEGKLYIKIRNFLVKQGVPKNKAHDFIMK